MERINVLEDPDNAMAAFDLLEGNGWWKQSIHADDYGKDHPAYATSLAAWFAYRSEHYREEQSEFLHGFGPMVYGNGGLHRYFIKKDGTVVFSSFHASRANSRNAESLGFLISH